MTDIAEFYESKSQGRTPIKAMVYRHAKSSLATLEAEEPGRTAEINGLRAHLAMLDEAHAAATAEGANAPPADEAPATARPDAGNSPSDTWGAIKAHLDDLLTEAKNWADGSPILTQAQADEVARLRDQLRAGEGAADDARKAERAPHDVVVEEIQARYNAYIAPLKNRVPGKVPQAYAALGVAQTAWLKKVEDEQRAEAKRLREIADAVLTAAAEKVREAAQGSDIEAREEAESIFAEAKTVERAATQAENAKAHAIGDGKAQGLRDHWIARVADPVAALRWAWADYRSELEAYALQLAQKEVTAGRRTIPGFLIENDRRV